MQACFQSAAFQTPHGGPPFDGWRKGFGFGYAKGPGDYMLDPSCPNPLRCSPNGDRALASNAFWRRKWEVGQANGLGVGDRPSYDRPQDCWIGPDTHGDVSVKLHLVKPCTTRRGITIKPRFPSMEEKYRDLSWPKCGPGPAKYNTSIPCGQSGWCMPAPSPAWTMLPRVVLQPDLKEMMSKPGPSEYQTRVKPGTNSPILHGTLFDISMKGRTKIPQVGECSPGPARYMIKGKMDEYGLWEKIANVKVPKTRKPDFDSDDALLAGSLFSSSVEAASKPSLSRVQSGPV